MGTTTTSTAPANAGLEHKAAAAAGGGELLSTDDTTGVVEAIVSVTGIDDDVNDHILPGAYADTLQRRRPKGVFGHDWGRWTSKTLDVAELPPGDPRLPKQTSDGQPWPTSAGGLYVKTQFNLDTDEGRDAYSNVKFFGPDTEWSIGYRVPPGGAYRRKDGVRVIKKVDLYEYSPVLFGAARGTSTLSIKHAAAGPQQDTPAEVDTAGDGAAPDGETLDDGAGTGEGGGGTGDGDGLAALHAAAADTIDWDEVDQAAQHAPADDDTGDTGGEGDGAGAADAGTPGVKAAGISNRPWSDFQQSDYTIEQWRRACLVGPSSPSDNKGDYKLPVREPSGALNRNAVHAAAAALAGARGGTDLSPEQRAKAAAALRGLYRRLGEKPPDSLAGKDADSGREEKAGVPGVADTPSDAASAERLKHWYVRGEGAARILWGKKGDFMRCVRIAGKHMPPERAKGFCALRHRDALGVMPGQEKDDSDDLEEKAGPKGYRHGWIYVGPTAVGSRVFHPRHGHGTVRKHGGGESSVHFDSGHRETFPAKKPTRTPEHFALEGQPSGGSRLLGTGPGMGTDGPTTDQHRIDLLAHAFTTRLNQDDISHVRYQVNKNHIAVQDADGMLGNINTSLRADELARIGMTPESFAEWLGKLGAQPAKARRKKDIEEAAQAAAGTPYRWTGGYDPDAEVGEFAGYLPPPGVESKGRARLPGSLEELRDALTDAAAHTLASLEGGDGAGGDGGDWGGVTVDGTWPDRVVVTRRRLDGKDSGAAAAAESYEIPYTVADDGTVGLGAPGRVVLTLTGDPDAPDVPAGDLLPVAELAEETAAAAKVLLHTPENKAGRVLSAANANRIRGAVENLVVVLKAAGITITTPGSEEDATEDETGDTGGDTVGDTTAPSARKDTPDDLEGKATLTPAEVAEGWRIIADAAGGGA